LSDGPGGGKFEMATPTLLLALGVFTQQGGGEPQESLLRAVHDAYVANQAAFPFGRVAFTYVQGSARNAAAARAGDFSPRYEAQGLYVFNEKLARHDRLFSEEDMRQTSTYIGNDIVSVLDSFRVETDGERTLYDSPYASAKSVSRATKLAAGRREFDGGFQFPISLGQPDHMGTENLGRHLRAALRGEPDARIADVKQNVTFEDRRTVKITIRLRYGDLEYWIDLDRGAVPLKIVARIDASENAPESEMVYHFDDVRQIPGRGWLPFRESWWGSRENKAGQILITEASFDRPPEASAFDVDFPEPITLVDEAKSVRYPARRAWNLASLPSPGGRGVEKVEFATIPLDALPKLEGERTAGSRYQLLILGLTTLAATVALLVWFQRRGRG
jgi:hypothetical protein